MTSEQLIQLMQWFAVSGGKFPLPNDIKFSADIWASLQMGLKSREVDLSKMEDQDLASQKMQNTEIVIVENAKKFITFCEKEKLQNIYEASLLWLVERYDSSDSRAEKFKYQQKMGPIFSTFLENQNAEAISFYAQRERLRSHYPTGAQLIKNSKTVSESDLDLKKLVEEITVKLHTIKAPLVIVPLLKAYFEKPGHLAAFIIWMRQQGLKEEEILQSGILQSIFIFHLHTIGDEDNPLNKFYSVLASHERTKKLVELATKTTVQREELQGYNLQGQVAKNLNVVEIKAADFDGGSIESQDLFNNLYELFGIEFLYQMLLCYYDDYDEEDYSEYLIAGLNNAGVASSALPALINQLLHSFEDEKLSRRLRSLSSLISKETMMEHLIANRQVLVMYLLIYRDDMEEFLELPFLIDYTEQLLNDKQISIERKFDLLCRLQTWCRENDKLALTHYLYQQLVALLLSPPDILLNDDNVSILEEEYHCLQDGENDDSSSEIEDGEEWSENEVIAANFQFQTLEFLEKQKSNCEQQWLDLCRLNLGKSTFEKTDYKELEENWPNFKQKMDFFHKTCSAKNEDRSSNKYTQFKETLVEQRFLLLGEKFNLQDMLSVIFNLSQEKEVIACQQLLINVLINNDGWLCEQAIKILGQYNRHWLLISWDNNLKPLLEEAVDRQNLKLATYLLSQEYDFCEKDSLFRAFEEAIEKKASPFIKLFLIPRVISQLDENDIKSLYLKALATQDRDLFSYFVENRRLLNLTDSLYSTLLSKAVEFNWPDGLSLLLGPKFKPKAGQIDKIFRQAFRAKNWECVEFLCGLEDSKRPSETTMDTAWQYVLEKMSWPEQERFVKACGNHFSHKMTCHGATWYQQHRKYEGLAFLLHLTGENQLTKSWLQGLLKSVLKTPTWFSIANILVNLPEGRALERADIENAILDVIVPDSNKTVLKLIYKTFEPELHPDADTVQQAFDFALRKGDAGILKILCKYSLTHLDSEMLLFSLAKARKKRYNQDVVRQLESVCRLKKITSKDADALMTGALKANDYKSVDLITNLSGELAPTFESLKKELFVAIEAGNLSVVLTLLRAPKLKENADVINDVFIQALSSKQIPLLSLLSKSAYFQCLSIANQIKAISFLVETNQGAMIQSLCEESATPFKLITLVFNQMVRLNKPEMISHLEKFNNFWQQNEWRTKLREVVQQGNLPLVKAITRAVARTGEELEILPLYQIAQKHGHKELVSWFTQIRTFDAYNRVTLSQDNAMEKAYFLLRDYTKSDSAWARFFTGHWNRHHVPAVTKILNSFPETVDELLVELQKIQLVNTQGSLARRITYITDFLLPLAENKTMCTNESNDFGESATGRYDASPSF
ncbi:DUF5617 domain-containing protein [Legionella brunensis]|uniref:RavJ-like C-terminal domain-containing protein n=1 Tax=Legionella brunensis TaxID=29422 RepID=A0A0W0SDR2_9GAMM|nr:DUF5617 domain-containing protein [Legionella brunensis]KTC81614.1 hypothetical protein Lbru_2134 [Legionella brunensis]